MNLRDIPYQEDYRSGYDDILNDFFRPSLKTAQAYWRAVGYFSSSALESFGSPLGDFIRNDGHIRLVTSVELSQADLAAIEAGSAKRDICTDRLEQIIQEEFSDNIGPGIIRLVRLIELGRLEIRIAIPKSGTGIYHEKIGLFFDSDVFVAFTGSSNESRNAFENNRECIDVYPSWQLPSRAQRKRVHFEQLWDGTDKGVEIYSLPEAVKRKLLHFVEEAQASKRTSPLPERWRHQEEAVKIFLDHERGVLNMATGTGKTRTALKIIHALLAADEIDSVIVSMEGTDLLTQWYEELLQERRTLSRAVRLFRDFDEYKEVQEFSLNPRRAVLLVSRRSGTMRDPLASALRHLTSHEASRTLLIHDEVHSLGSPANRERLSGLSASIRYRLGLSATPEREYDSNGNTFIEEHIGPVLMTFGLSEAISRGVLSPFNYFPLGYQLTDSDRERIRDVYRKRSARAAAGDPMSDEELWIELAKVYKTSPAKLPVFDDFIAGNRSLLERCIIFVETQDYGHEVLRLVHKYRPDFHTYFTGEQSGTLQRFARGDLECLVTCHRLSQGIDIRSLNTVILFSSARARLETIQRMGRCLRFDPVNPAKIANVVDFIRDSRDTDDPNADEDRSAWLTELSQLRPQGT